MRLIDADALKEEIEFHPTSVSVCMTVAEAKGQTYFKNRCLEDIDNAPTIPAIPVEWLRGLMNILVTGDANGQGQALFLSHIINEWQNEQEEKTCG